jgi:hypothetical protein
MLCGTLGSRHLRSVRPPRPSLTPPTIVQLCLQSDSYSDIISNFYSDHAKGSRHSNGGAYVGCLKGLLKFPRLAPVYPIVDSLDECPNTLAVQLPRTKVSNLIKILLNHNS